jgi:hypothetical protein
VCFKRPGTSRRTLMSSSSVGITFESSSLVIETRLPRPPGSQSLSSRS